MLAGVAVYRYAISPLFPSRCRYYPTCSAYADEAIRRYGALRGGKLALQRLSRCHPLGSHGVDPVPDLPNPQSNCCQRKA
ncbi:membrane protein insertion efficiency factor YidD [Bacterioplanoides pacificum]|uniref:Putative membrane protein insertion efficiency factor n=1 Tax=Bacterioplanoides pacificum TaxID=1171596 RepID=A0ABV7VTE1_9GAMM